MLATAGCSGGSPTSSTHGSKAASTQPAMTPVTAAAYAEKILQDTAGALTTRPRLETSPAGEPGGILNNTSVCTDGPNASEMVVVSRGYWLRGITAGDYASSASRCWPAGRACTGVITDSHGSGQLPLGAISVCLWPHAVLSSGRP